MDIVQMYNDIHKTNKRYEGNVIVNLSAYFKYLPAELIYLKKSLWSSWKLTQIDNEWIISKNTLKIN